VCMHAFFLALGSAEKEANWAHEYGIPHDGYTITDADTTTLYNAHTPTLQTAAYTQITTEQLWLT